ncbi:MAG TPA: hypothetical protein VEV17_25425 [Bryobacteraceae bacterium]|nr:hypothetical protein [Bryobacteraceae bacterium]
MPINVRSTLCIIGLLAAPLCVVAQPRAALDPKSARAAKTADAFLNGAPFTLDQVLHLVGQDAIPLRRRKEAIQNRGIDFVISAETLGKLKAAGASEDMLELIKSKARSAPVAAASKPRPVGNVSVHCAPAECDVAVNGHSIGSTKDGALQLAGLAPGKWVIDFTKNGFIGRQSDVVVEENKTAAISATLNPDRTTQEVFGAALFRKIMQALGGEEGLQSLATVQAAGSATIWSHDGNSVRWSLHMRNRPDRALFQVKSGNVTHEVMFEGHEFKASKSLKGQDALELPASLGLIRDNLLAALIARLEGPQYKMFASQLEPSPNAEFALFAESGAGKVAIGVDSELRPQRVRITTETGVGSVVIAYSDYVRTDKAPYPKSMQVKPEGQQNGIEVHFDAVELNPKLKDSDYKLKNKFFSTLYN